jgi:hypothetical protein
LARHHLITNVSLRLLSEGRRWRRHDPERFRFPMEAKALFHLGHILLERSGISVDAEWI